MTTPISPPVPISPTLSIGGRQVVFNDTIFIPQGESARIELPNGDAGMLRLSLRFEPIESDAKGIRWGPIEDGSIVEIVFAGGSSIESMTNDLIQIGDSDTHVLYFVAGYTRSKAMDSLHFMLLTGAKNV